ncbi:MAG: hypothetical protein WC558_16430 [Patulibacter sp.]
MRNYWLLLSANGTGKYGGHTGYADDIATTYQWDDTVPHAKEISRGDVILLRDSEALLGVSVIDSIEQWDDYKLTLRCPACNTPKITVRTTKVPKYRCTGQSCRTEFDEPVIGTPIVRKFATQHGAGWLPLPGLMNRIELQRLCMKPKSIQSMRPLIPARVEDALGAFIDQMFKLHGDVDAATEPLPPVRLRSAPAETRQTLLDKHGNRCLFVGDSPSPTIEGVALSQFGASGAVRPRDFVLMRRDIRSLVDLGQLTVDPERDYIRVSGEARDWSPYRELEGEPLQLALSPGQRQWFNLHWKLHSMRA